MIETVSNNLGFSIVYGEREEDENEINEDDLADCLGNNEND